MTVRKKEVPALRKTTTALPQVADVLPVEDVPNDVVPTEDVPIDVVPKRTVIKKKVPALRKTTTALPQVAEVIPTEDLPTDIAPTMPVIKKKVPALLKTTTTLPQVAEVVPTEDLPTDIVPTRTVIKKKVPVLLKTTTALPQVPDVVPTEDVPKRTVIKKKVPALLKTTTALPQVPDVVPTEDVPTNVVPKRTVIKKKVPKTTTALPQVADVVPTMTVHNKEVLTLRKTTTTLPQVAEVVSTITVSKPPVLRKTTITFPQAADVVSAMAVHKLPALRKTTTALPQAAEVVPTMMVRKTEVLTLRKTTTTPPQVAEVVSTMTVRKFPALRKTTTALPKAADVVPTMTACKFPLLRKRTTTLPQAAEVVPTTPKAPPAPSRWQYIVPRFPDVVLRKLLSFFSYKELCVLEQVDRRWSKFVDARIHKLFDDLVIQQGVDHSTFLVQELRPLRRLDVCCSFTEESSDFLSSIMRRCRTSLTSLTCDCRFLGTITEITIKKEPNRRYFSTVSDCWLVLSYVSPEMADRFVAILPQLFLDLKSLTLQIHLTGNGYTEIEKVVSALTERFPHLKLLCELQAETETAILKQIAIFKNQTIVQLKAICTDFRQANFSMSNLHEVLQNANVDIASLAFRDWSLRCDKPWERMATSKLRISSCSVGGVDQFIESISSSNIEHLELAGQCTFSGLEYLEKNAHVEFIHRCHRKLANLNVDSDDIYYWE